jgi:hypothetical protein
MAAMSRKRRVTLNCFGRRGGDMVEISRGGWPIGSHIGVFQEENFPVYLSLKAITLLSEAVVGERESLLAFLDRICMYSKRGNVSEDVLVASALRAVPRSLAHRLLMEDGDRVGWISCMRCLGLMNGSEKRSNAGFSFETIILNNNIKLEVEIRDNEVV